MSLTGDRFGYRWNEKGRWIITDRYTGERLKIQSWSAVHYLNRIWRYLETKQPGITVTMDWLQLQATAGGILCECGAWGDSDCGCFKRAIDLWLRNR